MTCKFMEIFYGPEEAPEAKELGQKSHEASRRVEGAPYPLGAPSVLVGSLLTLPDLFSTPKIPINAETPEKKPILGVPPSQASVAMKNKSRSRSSTLPEGETITGGHLHHPGSLHDEEGVVHPRG